MTEDKTRCGFCGQPLDAAGHCSACNEQPHTWTLRDWRPLSILALVIILGFSFTQMVVGLFKARQDELAAQYYQAGVQAMDAHQPAAAVDAFETALVYSRENFQYRLKLTDALLASGATGEAYAQLRGFWEQRPGDAQVNLKLARLEAARKHPEDAVRYYGNAIEGVWPERTDPVPQRIEVRFEMADYLASQGRSEQAEAALLALAAVLPPESPQQLRMGALLLHNGDATSALKCYQAVLSGIERERRAPHPDAARVAEGREDREMRRVTATLGAAQASFALANYSLSRHYLVELPADLSGRRELAAQMERLEALDPFAEKISPLQRRERIIADFRISIDRLSRCDIPFAVALSKGTPAPAAEPVQWSQFGNWAARLAPMMNERKLRGRDDIIESAMRFAFQAEEAAQPLCGQPSPDDQALILLARQRLGAQQ